MSAHDATVPPASVQSYLDEVPTWRDGTPARAHSATRYCRDLVAPPFRQTHPFSVNPPGPSVVGLRKRGGFADAAPHRTPGARRSSPVTTPRIVRTATPLHARTRTVNPATATTSKTVPPTVRASALEPVT